MSSQASAWTKMSPIPQIRGLYYGNTVRSVHSAPFTFKEAAPKMAHSHHGNPFSASLYPERECVHIVWSIGLGLESLGSPPMFTRGLLGGGPSAPTALEAPPLTWVMLAPWLLGHVPLLARSHAAHRSVVLQGQALPHLEGRASIHSRQPRYSLAVPDEPSKFVPTCWGRSGGSVWGQSSMVWGFSAARLREIKQLVWLVAQVPLSS